GTPDADVPAQRLVLLMTSVEAHPEAVGLPLDGVVRIAGEEADAVHSLDVLNVGRVRCKDPGVAGVKLGRERQKCELCIRLLEIEQLPERLLTVEHPHDTEALPDRKLE